MELLPLSLLILFAITLIIIAFLYASVGHGGASGYLALMALFSFSISFMRPAALLLNILVSGIAFLFYKKKEHFKWKLFYPFAITSIPAAFIGGYTTIETSLYKTILACFLILAILRMFNVFGKKSLLLEKPKFWIPYVLGFFIGLFSGMIGIGGGIILSPIIILLGMGTIKESAAVSALFIFVNSISGIFGLIFQGNKVPVEIFYFIPLALVGGSIGAFYGSSKFKSKTLTYLLSFVLIIASIKLLLV